MELFTFVLIVVSWVFLIVLLIVTAFLFQSLVALWVTRVPYVPTPQVVIDTLVSKISVPENAVVYDFGCGDGRFLRAVTKRHAPKQAIGYELSWWPYVCARMTTRGFDTISIRRRDFFSESIADADIVFSYLLPKLLTPLSQKLEKEAKSGTIWYSYAFEVPGKQPTQIIEIPYKKGVKKVFVYVI